MYDVHPTPHTLCVNLAPGLLSTGIVNPYLGIVTSVNNVRNYYPLLTVNQQICTADMVCVPVGMTDDV